MIFSGINSSKIAGKIAKHKKQKVNELRVKEFPDGELYLRFMKPIKGKNVEIIQTFHPNPNKALLISYFSIITAKELGAKKVRLIAPYLGFMRQDKRFHSGECQSNKIMADLLSSADEVITFDPHLHRINDMNEIFKTKTKKLSANKTIEEYIKKNWKDPWIIGPDSESYQWAKEIAKHINAHSTILKKKRYSSTVVRIKVKNVEVKGKDVIIVDDIISSGNTMIEPIKQLKKMGAKSITCICIHGIFALDALQRLRRLGVKVISTNTIENPVSKIDISSVAADSF